MAGELLLWASKIVSDYFIFAIPVLLLLAAFKLRNFKALAIALVVAGVVGMALKPALAEARPCNAGGSALVECPQDYGMPSLHATAAGVFALASLGSPWFYFLAPLAAFVSYSRVYLGVHSLEQVAAGIALAMAAHAFGAYAAKNIKGGRKMARRLWMKKIVRRRAGR